MLGEGPGKASPGHFTTVARVWKDEVALPGEGEGRERGCPEPAFLRRRVKLTWGVSASECMRTSAVI